MSKHSHPTLFLEWLAQQKGDVLPFQKKAWEHVLKGESGLISVPTGAGKTYAAYLPALAEMHANPSKGLQILYISPLKALARDLEIALQKPITDLNLEYRVEMRTGDTKTSMRKKQKSHPPEILLTTPESLAILLSDSTSKQFFSHLKTVILDEWHELLGSKRGVLLELCMARLRKWNPDLKTWGLSATIGNLEEAAQICVGNHRPYTLITSALKREVNLESVLPDRLEKLPWAGQLGLRMAPLVSHVLSPNQSTLIFTNTRSQAERWHQALVELNPEWEPLMALHHSSIDKSERERIEQGMKEGTLRLVVCTSSLDLGIDFALVEKVLQIGSPKSIARLIQRAGRSSHRPMTPCHLAIVPTHALEVVELKGYRMALEAHEIESRKPLSLCFDVLIQHLATCAISGGFTKIEMWEEITSTAAFAALKPLEYDQCLNFLMNGGVLHAYPEYHKLILEDDLYKIIDKQIIQRHRMNIGVIASDPHVPVKLTNGKTIGAIEENFMAGLEPGDRFLFAGRILELVQFRDLVATVRIGKGETKTAAVWQGSRLPFSAPLGRVLRKALRESDEGYPETAFLKQISDLQNKFSYLPHEDELLIESLKTREGWHLYLYPFEGKLIHQGLASLLAHRLTREAKSTFTLSSNDYGLELLSKQPIHEGLLTSHLFRSDHLEEEVQEILNLYELARGSFRDIARISGLVFQGYPGKHKSHRQIQVSTGLLYEVFTKYDPQNLLLQQARKEVLEKHFEIARLKQVLERMANSRVVIKHPKRLTPFALPLYVERVSGQLTTETLADRIERIKAGWKMHG
jgi:ATP-dependent Lhr-like helicase